MTLTLKSLSRVRLCDPMDCSLPGSSVHGIFQARVLELGRGDCYFLLQEIFPTQGSNPSLPPCRQTLYRLSHQGSLVDYRYSVVQQMPRAYSSCLTETVSEWVSEVAQSCPTLCDPMNCSLPGSSLHGILQARVLEWVAISFSRGSSRPRDRIPVSCIPGRRFNLWATTEAHLPFIYSPSPSTASTWQLPLTHSKNLTILLIDASCKWNHAAFVFYKWFISLSTISSSFISVIYFRISYFSLNYWSWSDAMG